MTRRPLPWRAVLLLGTLCSLHAVPPAAAETQTEQLTRQGLEAATPEEAVGFMKQALDLAPQEPLANLNYGTVLFKAGQRALQAGQTEQGTAMFRDAEKALQAALRLAKGESNPALRKQCKSQAAFLLGDIQFYVFKDKARAKRYYQETLWYDPRHPGALAARERFNED